MPYTIALIMPDEKEELATRYLPRVRYEVKSEIYGCCIKLLCDDPVVTGTWRENFAAMSENVRSHGRLFVFSDPAFPKDTVRYDPYSKTAFLINIRYYGWIKSLALSCAGDILEDEHGIFSVHGACVDIGGAGLCIVGQSGAGKTTQTYGLLSDPRTRIIADDWFFSRIFPQDILAYASEKNFYIREDLSAIWKDFAALKTAEEYDAEGRAVADIRWVIGKGRIFPVTTIRNVIVLKRDPADREIVRAVEPAEGRELFHANGYFNPHLLVTDSRKTRLRDTFFESLLSRAKLHIVNTTGTPAGTQEKVRAIAGLG